MIVLLPAATMIAASGAPSAAARAGGAPGQEIRLAAEDLPLGLPADLDAAAVILAAEDRRDLTPALLDATRSPVAGVRARAALAVGRIGLPEAYPRLLDLLRDPQAEVRTVAAFGLGLLELDLEPATESATRTRIAERLLRLLEDPQPLVVTQALWTLGRQADPLATDPVEALLGEASRPSDVVIAALDAWWRLPEASPAPLAEHLRSSDPAIRYAAATALRRLRDPDALPLLAEALNDSDAAVRASAVRGLHAAPAPVVRAHLVELLRDDDWRVVCAALGWAADLWRRKADVEDEVFTAVLRASATRSRSVQRLALEALVVAPGKFSVPDDRLIVALRGDDAAARAAAVGAIAAGDGSVAGEVLRSVRRVYGIEAPPRESSPSEVPALLAASPLEAAALVGVLAASGDATDGWARLLGEHGPVAARAEALRRLRRSDPDRAAEVAAGELRDGPPVLQAVAAEVIERLWAAGALTPPEGAADWTELLWSAQRGLGEVGALEPRMIVLGALLLVDAESLRARAPALLVDSDRVIRLWALRELRPPAGSSAAELIGPALGPQETGRTEADYLSRARRLLELQQHPPRVEVSTPRGRFVWQLEPAWAPLSVAAYLDWVQEGFFDEVVFHRVEPDFVVQAGDSTAVGYGGARGSLRSEETPIPFVDGVVGLALAGRDTGGSQFFIVQSPQPQLTGVYPALGRVIEGANVIERIQPGDRLEMRSR